jgi:hypothetical protein
MLLLTKINILIQDIVTIVIYKVMQKAMSQINKKSDKEIESFLINVEPEPNTRHTECSSPS